MRVAIHTLGCKVNQYESQAMEELLRARGHSLVPFEAQADVYLINSCTVTATSDKKSRQAVRQARKRAPGALVALCGCYPQVSPEAARQSVRTLSSTPQPSPTRRSASSIRRSPSGPTSCCPSGWQRRQRRPAGIFGPAGAAGAHPGEGGGPGRPLPPPGL